jgi:transglutaminase-like putative cysteine protease
MSIGTRIRFFSNFPAAEFETVSLLHHLQLAPGNRVTLGDIGVPPDPAPMDFSAWFEVFLGGRWFTFDAGHNRPRIGRVLIARGRDAADVAISTSFGAATLTRFNVTTEEVTTAAIQPEARQCVA